MQTVIVGAGEVGKSLYKVLKEVHEAYLLDRDEDAGLLSCDVLNICFPYSSEFDGEVRRYQALYNPKIIIIHSTVPVGTSRRLNATHSPIHGKHPDLVGGIKTFVKYVGGGNPMAIKFLNEAGIKTEAVGLEESELSKILCTTYYGWNIVFMKEAKKICDKLGLNFDEVYGWNIHYNDGYEKLGMGQFHRPVLDYQDGKIGGHCVIPNCRLLESDITNFILQKNEEY